MNVFKPLLLIALALAAVPALADTPIDQTHKLAADATLSVTNVAGTVIVHTWDRNEVHIGGTLGNNVRTLAVTGDARHLTIEVKGAGDKDSGWFHWGSSIGPATLDLTVPRGVNLSVHTVSARVRVDGLAGGRIDVQTVSGGVAINANSPAVDINSTSGNVTLAGSAQQVDVNTVSGDISVAHAGREASAQSVSGDIHVAGGPLEKVSMESVSGDLYLGGSVAADVAGNLHSMSGDIHVTLANAPGATLDASSFSGDITSAWGTVQKPTYGPGSSLHVRLGDGTGSITLKTFSGDVKIREGH